MSSFDINPEDVKGFWSDRDPSPDIIPAASFQTDLMEQVLNPDLNAGEKCPILPTFSLRPGELTVWAGNNGSGKSALMCQIALSMMMNGDSVCLLSFEMDPKETIMQMIRMAYGRSLLRTEADKVSKFFDWCEKRFWIYRNRGDIHPNHCFDAVAYAAGEKKCRHVFVDNLMMLTGGGSSDQLFQSQRKVVDTLKRISVEFSAHIHLVAHLRKLNSNQTANELPDRYSISGSADISNLADNVVIIFRNYKKEKEAQDMKTKNAGWDQDADTVLLLDKQRKNGRLAKQKLWYERGSSQFCLSPERQLMELMPRSISGIDTTRSHQAEALYEKAPGWL